MYLSTTDSANMWARQTYVQQTYTFSILYFFIQSNASYGNKQVESNLVQNQYMFFKCMHDLGKTGSVYLHTVPMVGSWFQHGVAHYDITFFTDLIENMGYQLVSLLQHDHGSDDLQNLVCIYKKVIDKPFLSMDEFASMDGLHSIYADYETLNVSFVLADTNGLKRTLSFRVNLSILSSKQAAEEYCFGQGFISYVTSIEGETDEGKSNRCVDFISKVIDAHRIENQIRS